LKGWNDDSSFAVVAAQKLEIEDVANTMKPNTSAAARHTT